MRTTPTSANRFYAFALVVGLAVAFALASSAQAARSTRGVTFVLLSGPHAGERIKADGGPNVPARLNGGRISGRLIPQSEGNEFTFKGTVRARARGRLRVAADRTDAEALPEEALPNLQSDLESAIYQEELPTVLGPQVQANILRLIEAAIGRLDTLRSSSQITAQRHDELVVDLKSAVAQDQLGVKDLHAALRAPQGSNQRTRLADAGSRALNHALELKRGVVRGLADLGRSAALLPAEPPPTPVAQPPVAVPGAATAINNDNGTVAGTLNPGEPGSSGFVLQNGNLVFLGGTGTTLSVFGPGGALGGDFKGSPMFIPDIFLPGEQPTALPKGDATGGTVRGGDQGSFVGAVFRTVAPHEQAALWLRQGPSRSRVQASALSFKGLRVKGFAGGSSLFTVSGNLAFGDHFDHGISGRFRAFALELRSGRITELFRPSGGSSQPLASNHAGTAAGASRLANGAVQVTYWWGGQHYLRFGSPGIDSLVAGMNDAGVGVGYIGPPTNHHAALFEHGTAYDLNNLIPAGSGWTLTKANAISNGGVIVGAGSLNGQQRGFVLNLSAARP